MAFIEPCCLPDQNSQLSVLNCLFSITVRDAVGKCHEGVVEVDVFHDGVGVFGGDVVVAEIPEAPHAEAVQPADDRLRRLLGNTEERRLYLLLAAKALQLRFIPDDNAVHQPAADFPLVRLKAARQRKAELFKINVVRDGGAEVSRADQDGGAAAVESQYVLDLMALDVSEI